MLAAFANAPAIEAQQKGSGADLHQAVRAQRSAAPHQMGVGVDPHWDRCQKAGTQLLLLYFHGARSSIVANIIDQLTPSSEESLWDRTPQKRPRRQRWPRL